MRWHNGANGKIEKLHLLTRCSTATDDETKSDACRNFFMNEAEIVKRKSSESDIGDSKKLFRFLLHFLPFAPNHKPEECVEDVAKVIQLLLVRRFFL